MKNREIKIGLFAIVAIVLLYSLISFLKGINIFKATNTYYASFADINGLAVSAPVYANGYAVGIVRSIDYDYSRTDKVVVSMELDKEMRVPQGTRAELTSSLMGGVTMNLLLGNPARYLNRGDTLLGGPHLGAMTQVESAMPVVVSLLPKIDSIMANLNALTGDPAMRTMLTNAAEISTHLRNTSARLDDMTAHDMPQLLAQLRQTSQNLNTLTSDLASADVKRTIQKTSETLTELQGFSKNLNLMSAGLNEKLNSTDNSLGLLLGSRHLYDNLNHTVQSADSLVTDLKEHPKRYVHFSVFGKKDK